MVTRQDIQATCDDIVREFAPLQVILFGSHAYGTPTAESDVDLLVVMPVSKSETRHQAAEILQNIPNRFRMDLLVRSPEEIAYRISYNDWFLREITEKGEVLYESDDFFTTPVKKEKFAMNPLTLEWIQKAEGDYTIMFQNYQSLTPVYDGICFHAQQCIEKYLKAWLQEADIRFSKTHNLKDLLNLIIPTIPEWQAWHDDFSAFTTHAVDIRYPGEFATAKDAAHGVQICTAVREAVRAQLNL